MGSSGHLQYAFSKLHFATMPPITNVRNGVVSGLAGFKWGVSRSATSAEFTYTSGASIFL